SVSVKQLPVMGGRPLNRAQALAKIAEIKAKFGLKGGKALYKKISK
ncbi:Replication protein P, partial [Escherichia coli]